MTEQVFVLNSNSEDQKITFHTQCTCTIDHASRLEKIDSHFF